MQAYATPGEYASERSRWFASALVGTTEILPGVGNSWYSSASTRSCSSDIWLSSSAAPAAGSLEAALRRGRRWPSLRRAWCVPMFFEPHGRAGGVVASQPVRTVRGREVLRHDTTARGERDHLEELAHLRGRQQPLHGGRLAQVRGRRGVSDGRAAGRGCPRRSGTPPATRSRRPRGRARSPASRDRGEVDVRGEVGQARPQERVGVRAMPVVRHQRARRCARGW